MLALVMVWAERRLGLLIALNLFACLGAVVITALAFAVMWLSPLGVAAVVVGAGAVALTLMQTRMLIGDRPPTPEWLVVLITLHAMLAAGHLLWAVPGLMLSDLARPISVAGVFVGTVLAIDTYACFRLMLAPETPNTCSNCGYDITGLGRCPECGTNQPRPPR